MANPHAAYAESHVSECRLYGVKPLSNRKARALSREGRSLAFAFSLASDLAAGFSEADAKAAAERASL